MKDFPCCMGMAARGECSCPPKAIVDVTGLEPDAVRVVELVVSRLRFGQHHYGPLDLRTNPRDWRAEANEEFIDGALYFAMRSLQRPIDREISVLKETIRELERAGDVVGARAASMMFVEKVRERAGITAPAAQE